MAFLQKAPSASFGASSRAAAAAQAHADADHAATAAAAAEHQRLSAQREQRRHRTTDKASREGEELFSVPARGSRTPAPQRHERWSSLQAPGEESLEELHPEPIGEEVDTDVEGEEDGDEYEDEEGDDSASTTSSNGDDGDGGDYSFPSNEHSRRGIAHRTLPAAAPSSARGGAGAVVSSASAVPRAVALAMRTTSSPRASAPRPRIDPTQAGRATTSTSTLHVDTSLAQGHFFQPAYHTKRSDLGTAAAAAALPPTREDVEGALAASARRGTSKGRRAQRDPLLEGQSEEQGSILVFPGRAALLLQQQQELGQGHEAQQEPQEDVEGNHGGQGEEGSETNAHTRVAYSDVSSAEDEFSHHHHHHVGMVAPPMHDGTGRFLSPSRHSGSGTGAGTGSSVGSSAPRRRSRHGSSRLHKHQRPALGRRRSSSRSYVGADGEIYFVHDSEEGTGSELFSPFLDEEDDLGEEEELELELDLFSNSSRAPDQPSPPLAAVAAPAPVDAASASAAASARTEEWSQFGSTPSASRLLGTTPTSASILRPSEAAEQAERALKEADAEESRQDAWKRLDKVDLFYATHDNVAPWLSSGPFATSPTSSMQREQQQLQVEQDDVEDFDEVDAHSVGPQTTFHAPLSAVDSRPLQSEQYEQLLAMAPSALSAGVFSTSRASPLAYALLHSEGATDEAKTGARRGRKRRHRRRPAADEAGGTALLSSGTGRFPSASGEALLGMLSGDYTHQQLERAGFEQRLQQQQRRRERLAEEDRGEESGADLTDGTADGLLAGDDARSSKRSNTSRSTARTHATSDRAGAAGAGPVTMAQAIAKAKAKAHAKAKAKAKAAAARKVAGSNTAVITGGAVRRASGPATQQHPQQPEASAGADGGQQLSRGQRVVGAILRRVFDLDNEVLDTFLNKDSIQAASTAEARGPVQFGFGHGSAEAPLDYTHASSAFSTHPHRHHHHHHHHHHRFSHALAQIDESQEAYVERGEEADDEAVERLTPISIQPERPVTHFRRRISSYSTTSGASQAGKSNDSGFSIGRRGSADSGAELLEGLPQHLEPTTLEALNALVGGVPFRVWNEIVKRLGIWPSLRAAAEGGAGAGYLGEDAEADEYEEQRTLGRRSRASSSAFSSSNGSATQRRMADAGAGLPAQDSRDVLPKAWRGQIHPAIAAMHEPAQDEQLL